MMVGMVSWLRNLGADVVDYVHRVGVATTFLFGVFSFSGTSWQRFSVTIRQMYFTGVLSILIIVVSGTFVGMVLALQAYNVLQRFGSTEILGVMVALSLLRELGPVLAAILFASRAGSSITTEIGLMKVTQQLDAMELMAVNPMARIVAPRFWSGVLSMPLLTAMFSAMGILGGYLVGVIFLGVDKGVFWSQMSAGVRFHEDVANSVIKSLVFGVVVSWIAVFEGMYAKPTAEGVSRATTRTVVSSALAVLLLDFILTAFMFR